MVNIRREAKTMGKHVRYILTEYVEHALGSASYDKLEDGTFAGKVEQCPGVIAFGDTLLDCQSNLRATLEGWIVLGLRLGHSLPRIDGIDLNGDGYRRPAEPAKRKKAVRH